MARTDERTARKVRENRLRRMAERQGLALMKSRRRDPFAADFDRWYVIDPLRIEVAGGHVETMDMREYVVAGLEERMELDEIEAFLTDPSRRRR